MLMPLSLLTLNCIFNMINNHICCQYEQGGSFFAGVYQKNMFFETKKPNSPSISLSFKVSKRIFYFDQVQGVLWTLSDLTNFIVDFSQPSLSLAKKTSGTTYCPPLPRLPIQIQDIGSLGLQFPRTLVPEDIGSKFDKSKYWTFF